jgi:multisubunit Na+/H+ antiporter MnhB subunit
VTSLAADLIGICGSLLFIGAFLYANRAPTLNKILFNAVNLTGAVLLLISLSVNFNLAAVILEVAWGIIAAAGLISALRARRS